MTRIPSFLAGLFLCAGAHAQLATGGAGYSVTPPPCVPASATFHPSAGLTGLGFGDSITANAGSGQTGVPCVTTFCQSAINGSPLTWISFYTNQRVYFPQGFNCGNSGDTAALLLARVSCVLNLHPDIVAMQIGANDASLSVSCASFIATDRQIIQIFRAAGITVFEYGVYPRSSPSAYTTAQASLAQCYNQARATYASQAGNNGYFFIPLDAAVVDPTVTASWAVRSGYLTDGVHPSEVGGSVIGKLVADKINAVIPDWRVPLFSAADVYDATNNPYGNLLGADGLLDGTFGGVSVGCAGTAPTNWSVLGNPNGGATCVVGVSTGSDGRPITTITLSGTYTAPHITSMYDAVVSPSTVVSAGDILEAEACVNIGANTNVSGIFVSLVTTENSVVFTQQGGAPNTAATMPTTGWATGTPVCIFTPRRTVGFAPSLVQVQINIQAANGTGATIAGTVTVQSVAIRKIGS